MRKEFPLRGNLALPKIFTSLLIVSVISVQLYSAVLRGGCRVISLPLLCDLPEEPGLYPFLDYPMYSKVKAAGTAVEQKQLVAIFAEGGERVLRPEDFGMNEYWFIGTLLPAFERKNRQKLRSISALTKNRTICLLWLTGLMCCPRL